MSCNKKPEPTNKQILEDAHSGFNAYIKRERIRILKLYNPNKDKSKPPQRPN